MAQLPLAEQYATVELFRGTIVRHSIVVYRNDSPRGPRTVSFDGDSWHGYVPIRMADTICIQERLPPGAAAVLINKSHTYRDLFMSISLTEKRWLDAIDGNSCIGDIVEDRLLPIAQRIAQIEMAQAFFERLWWYDQVVFDASR
jgi:hypothetical protein